MAENESGSQLGSAGGSEIVEFASNASVEFDGSIKPVWDRIARN